MNKITRFFSEISQQTPQYDKNSHTYLNVGHNQITFHMHQQPMVPDHDIQYDEHPSRHHGGMCKDRLTD